MRKFTFLFLSALVLATPAAAASVEMVTPIQPGYYASEAGTEGDLQLARDGSAYLNTIAGHSDVIAFAKLSCTPYMLMMTFSYDLNRKPFVMSMFVAVDADGQRLTIPQMLNHGDADDPVPFILDKVSSRKNPFTTVAAKGCQYFQRFGRFDGQADTLTRQAP